MFINLITGANGGGIGTAGVNSLNGQKGDLNLKTINNNELLGEGNIEIQAGDNRIINLNNLTQEELVAVYNKLDKTTFPKEIFLLEGISSFFAEWEGNRNLKIYFLKKGTYGGGEVKRYSLGPDGYLGEENSVMNYVNFLTFNVSEHIAEGADFETNYTGDFYEFMYRPYTEPNGYLMILRKGIGDTTKKMVVPVTVIWDKDYDGSDNIPIRIQFTAGNKLYTYIHGDTDNKWTFESSVVIGNINSSEVSNIKVLTQAEYDAIDPKDEKTLYMIKG